MSSGFFMNGPWVVAFIAASLVPAVQASTVCVTDNFGYTTCNNSWSWQARTGLSFGILLLLLLFFSLFFCRSSTYYDNEPVVYVQQPVRVIPTTYGRPYNYDPEAAPVNTQTLPMRSYSATTASFPQKEVGDSVRYPRTAYPFTGYTVTPPGNHVPSGVHNAEKVKDAS